MHLKIEEVDAPEKRGKYTVTLIGCANKAVQYALAFADAGFKVVCVDPDQSVIKRLSKGRVYLGDRKAESKLKYFISKEQLNVTSDLKGAVSSSDVLLFNVDVKIDNKKEDASEIEGLCKQIGKALQKGSLIVYCGVAGLGAVETIIKENVENTSGLKVGEDFGLAYCPMHFTKGTEQHIGDRELIIASNDKISLDSTALIFQQITKRCVKKSSDTKILELTMLFAAVKQDVAVALANEMAMFCEKASVDYIEIAKLLEYFSNDAKALPTISEEAHRHESYLLIENADNLNAKFRLPSLATKINEEMTKYAVNLVQDALHDGGKTLRRARVAILGATKAGTAASRFGELLRTKGVKITWFDPTYSVAEQPEDPSLKRTLDEAVEGTDCIVIFSNVDQFKRLNLKRLRLLMKTPVVLVDLGGDTEPEKVASNGFIYRGLGRGERKK